MALSTGEKAAIAAIVFLLILAVAGGLAYYFYSSSNSSSSSSSSSSSNSGSGTGSNTSLPTAGIGSDTISTQYSSFLSTDSTPSISSNGYTLTLNGDGVLNLTGSSQSTPIWSSTSGTDTYVAPYMAALQPTGQFCVYDSSTTQKSLWCSTTDTTTPSGYSPPFALTINSSGNLCVTDVNNNSLWCNTNSNS